MIVAILFDEARQVEWYKTYYMTRRSERTRLGLLSECLVGKKHFSSSISNTFGVQVVFVSDIDLDR